MCVRWTNKSSHLNILSAVFGPYVTTFMQIKPFYINSDYNVWRFRTAPFESTLKAALPKGRRISPCVCVCVCSCLCVSCVCSFSEPRDISDATTVPVSRIPLKKHVDSDKPPLPPLSSLFLSPPGMDWSRRTSSRHSSPAARVFDFYTFYYPPAYILLFQIISFPAARRRGSCQ